MNRRSSTLVDASLIERNSQVVKVYGYRIRWSNFVAWTLGLLLCIAPSNNTQIR